MSNSSYKYSSTSYNSYYPSKVSEIEKQILHIVNKSDIELRPAEIARKIHAPYKPTNGEYSTVRVYCGRLLQRGLIIQAYPGAYCNKITYGVRFLHYAVHNVRFYSCVGVDLVSERFEEVVGGVVVKWCFGSERRKVSGILCCDAGMSRDACLLALQRWFDVAEKRLGFALESVVLTTFEANKDHVGVRVDGVSCVTKVDLYGFIRREYQKEDAFRQEVKVSQSLPINKFEALMENGFAGMEGGQQLFELTRSVAALGEALKCNNRVLVDLTALTKVMSDSMVGMKDSIVGMKESVSAMKDSMVAMNEALVVLKGTLVVDSAASMKSLDHNREYSV